LKKPQEFGPKALIPVVRGQNQSQIRSGTRNSESMEQKNRNPRNTSPRMPNHAKHARLTWKPNAGKTTDDTTTKIHYIEKDYNERLTRTRT